jgi:hypothetical protein
MQKRSSPTQHWRRSVNSKVVGLAPGANPWIVSYNVTNSLVRFNNKNVFFS